MLSRTGTILTFATGAVVLGDATEAFAQAALSSDQPLLYAEAGKRRWRRRRRPRKAPPPAKAPEETAEAPAAEEDGGATAENGAAAPAPEEGPEKGTKLENPFEDETPETPLANPDAEVTADGGSPLRRSNRMDFDERLIKGQGARSGAVYLFKRTPRKLPELVSLRTSYRARIVHPVLGRRTVQPPPAKATAKASRAAPAEAPEKQPEEEVEETAAQKAAKAKAARRRRWRQRMLRRRRAAKRRAKKAQ